MAFGAGKIRARYRDQSDSGRRGQGRVSRSAKAVFAGGGAGSGGIASGDLEAGTQVRAEQQLASLAILAEYGWSRK